MSAPATGDGIPTRLQTTGIVAARERVDLGQAGSPHPLMHIASATRHRLQASQDAWKAHKAVCVPCTNACMRPDPTPTPAESAQPLAAQAPHLFSTAMQRAALLKTPASRGPHSNHTRHATLTASLLLVTPPPTQSLHNNSCQRLAHSLLVHSPQEPPELASTTSRCRAAAHNRLSTAVAGRLCGVCHCLCHVGSSVLCEVCDGHRDDS